jgi:hypothetical protein
MPDTTTTALSRCIDNCLACHRACLETFRHCLMRGSEHVQALHLTLLLDCAEACRSSAEFMLRGSPHHHLTCRVCAELCDLCAIECQRMDHDECARTCRACAETCRRMAVSDPELVGQRA